MKNVTNQEITIKNVTILETKNKKITEIVNLKRNDDIIHSFFVFLGCDAMYSSLA